MNLRTPALGSRLGFLAVELAILAGVYFILRLREPALFIGIGAVLTVSTLSPPRFSAVVAGVALLGLALADHLLTGRRQIPQVIALIGAVAVIYGSVMLVSGRRAGAPRRNESGPG